MKRKAIGWYSMGNSLSVKTQDVVFDETENQTTKEIDNLLSHMEKMVTLEKTIHQRKPN
jgi:hypothetical protein